MDLQLIESGNGGDLVKTTKDLCVIEGLENMVYLALFGGNVQASTPTDRVAGEQAFDWWGNSLDIDQPELQFNSLTERTLHNVALTSAGRIQIENAVKFDLRFMEAFAGVSVSVSIPSTDRVTIDIVVQQPNNVSEKQFRYIWDATKSELYSGLCVSAPETVTPKVSTFGSLSSDVNKWAGGVLAGNGYIYCIPFQAQEVLKIDPITRTATSFGTISGTGQKWQAGVYVPGGAIYGVPYNATDILKIDTLTDTVTRFGSFAGSTKWVGAVLAPNGKIYCVPYLSSSILVIDPSDDSTYTIGSFGAGNKWAGAALATNGKIYCMPFDASSVLVIDPGDDSTYTFGVLSGSSKWNGGTLGPDGKVYACPRSSNTILVINPIDDSYEEFASVANGFYGMALAANGKIYCPPVGGTQVLEINTEAQTTSLIGEFGSSVWIGMAMGRNGNVFGIPFTATTILEISNIGRALTSMVTIPDSLVNLPSSLYNRHQNKY